MLTKVFRPALRAVRKAHHVADPNNGARLADMTKWTPQTPTSFIHDGYALSVSARPELTRAVARFRRCPSTRATTVCSC